MCECKEQLDRIEAHVASLVTDLAQAKAAVREAASNPMLRQFLPKF